MFSNKEIKTTQEWKEQLQPYFIRLQEIAMKDENIRYIGMDETYRNRPEGDESYGQVVISFMLKDSIEALVSPRTATGMFNFYTGYLEGMSKQNFSILSATLDLLEEGKYIEALTLSRTAL